MKRIGFYRQYFYLAIALLVISGCSVEKRIYHPGYHITREHRSSARPANSSTTDENTTAGIADDIQPLPSPEAFTPVADSCDQVSIQNGSPIRRKITETGTTEVKYKRYDKLREFPVTVTPPVVNSNTDHYKKGDNDLAEKNARISNKMGTASLITEGAALLQVGLGVLLLVEVEAGIAPVFLFVSAFLALLAAFIFGIIAIIGGSIAKKKDNSSNGEYKKQGKKGMLKGIIGVCVPPAFLIIALILINMLVSLLA